MIVRILGEGQREVAEEHVPELNELDQALADTVTAGDELGFERQLTALLQRVRTVGIRVPDDVLTVSDSILPVEGSSLTEVRALLGEQGLIPG
ncbi:MAG: PspA-associated protein PspAA [Mycobacteriaceae bacterium]